MNMLKGAAVIGQSGGPTAAINATLAGAVKALSEEKRRSDGLISAIYGMKNGIEGFLEERIVDLGSVFGGDDGEEKLELLSRTPAAALGSCRKKLPELEGNEAFYRKLIGLFRKYDIRYFFYIGGNDSMDTVAKLSAYTAGCDYEMRIVGLPKTIDNDLCGTDHTPGFGSCAKYVATTLQEICLDCAVYTIPAVTIVEIMGRDAGWLTAAAALPGQNGNAVPDLIYLPERAFSVEGFLADVRAELEKKPYVVIAVSEGIRTADGTYICEFRSPAALDVFGHTALTGTSKTLEHIVKERIGCKVRSVELNISQRCAAHTLSGTDISESLAVGAAGVSAALAGGKGSTGIMMAIIRESDSPYRVSYRGLDVSEIANRVRFVPDEYINNEGNNVTAECVRYLAPLVRTEIALRYENGLPKYFSFDS